MATPYDAQHSQTLSRIYHYADKYGIDREKGVKQLWQESRFKINAVSPVGAKGIAQFMPTTAQEWGVNTSDLESSLDGWGRYMRWLLDRPKIAGDYAKALAAYNWGIGNVERKGLAKLPAETANYLDTILGKNWRTAAKYSLGLGTILVLGFATYFLYKNINA